MSDSALAPAAQVPVAQVVEELLERRRRQVRLEGVQARRHFDDGLGQPRPNPAVEQRRRPLRTRRRRGPLIEVGVRDEEAVDVPQRDEEQPPGLVGHVVAEQQVLFRPLRGVQPAHDVDSHAIGGLVELDHVAGRLVHRPPVLGHKGGVGEDVAKRRTPLEDGAHGDQAVEPVAELSGEALADQVGREPARPFVAILSVAQRAHGDNARIQPGVADVRNAAHGLPAAAAGDLDLVDVGAVR
jgi:hypothetical protein